MRVKRLCVLCILSAAVAVAFVCFACYREVTMNEKMLDDGFRLMKAKDFGPAGNSFAEALKHGADPILCLSRIVECQIAMKSYPAALATCDQLNATSGGEAMGYTYRGIVFEKQGRPEIMARLQYYAGLKAGNEYAAINLDLLNRRARK
jgi:hypothetical protein